MVHIFLDESMLRNDNKNVNTYFCFLKKKNKIKSFCKELNMQSVNNNLHPEWWALQASAC